ncbi:isochorismatase [Marinomonas aquiplantarum]|uniref:isochorismatase n=1 Tax=Marinomonas aquiplantarum TaxID=491951 RepID=A0A366D1B6_9GAMM|nr:isochorismatase [Marinomonas aquiplantarum]RBO83870.1 bifunctional isochorismate lyase/aryl carrier protein [Marinomonas aquiplantarum]
MSIPTIPSYSMPAASDFPQQKVNWVLEPNRAVFLIHDMQAYFLRFYDADSELIKTLKQNLSAIKAYCHAHGIPVVYTAQPKDQKPEDRALLNDMWGSGLNDFPELQHVVDELTPSEQDTVLVKWRYSAFHRSNLQELMESWGRDQLLIGGVYAHIGCMMTAVDAFMRDIQPFMIGDALADFSESEHYQALTYTAGRAGRVISTNEVLLATSARSSSLHYEQFKTQILSLLDEEELEDFQADDELIDYGLDSIQIMNLVSQWKELGLEVSFQELASAATLNAWWDLLQAKMTTKQVDLVE